MNYFRISSYLIINVIVLILLYFYFQKNNKKRYFLISFFGYLGGCLLGYYKTLKLIQDLSIKPTFEAYVFNIIKNSTILGYLLFSIIFLIIMFLVNKKIVIKLLYLFFSLFLILILLFVLMFTSYTLEKISNPPLTIKNEQVAIFQRDNNYAAIIPILQHIELKRGRIRSHMKYEWLYFGNNTGIISKSIIKEGVAVVSDSSLEVGLIEIGKIKFEWSAKGEGEGYIYPGHIGENLKPPVKVKIISTKNYMKMKIKDNFKN